MTFCKWKASIRKWLLESEVKNLVYILIFSYFNVWNKQLHLVYETCLLASGYVYSLENCIPKKIFLKTLETFKAFLKLPVYKYDWIQMTYHPWQICEIVCQSIFETSNLSKRASTRSTFVYPNCHKELLLRCCQGSLIL